MSSTIATTATILLQQSADASSIEKAAAADVFKTAELHHRFVQDIRRQLEYEYNAAVDAEVAAARDLDLKRRRVEDATECQKRLRSEAFRSLVRDSGIATYGGALLKAPMAPSQRAAFRAASMDSSGYELEDGEITFESFTPDHTPPPSPRRSATAERE
jgi:hypothetical protein